MVYWDLPTVTNYNFIDIFLYTNTVTGNMAGMVTLLMIWIIPFMAFKRYPTEQALAASSFIAAISSYFLAVIGMIGTAIILVPTSVFLISIFLLFRK